MKSGDPSGQFTGVLRHREERRTADCERTTARRRSNGSDRIAQVGADGDVGDLTQGPTRFACCKSCPCRWPIGRREGRRWQGLATGGLVCEFQSFAGTGHDGMIAHYIATAQAVHANLFISPRAHNAFPAVAQGILCWLRTSSNISPNVAAVPLGASTLWR